MATNHAECAVESDCAVHNYSAITYWFPTLVVLFFSIRALFRPGNQPKPLNEATLRSITTEAKFGIKLKEKSPWYITDEYDMLVFGRIICTFKSILWRLTTMMYGTGNNSLWYPGKYVTWDPLLMFLDLVRHSFNRPKPLNDKSLESIFAETKLVTISAAKGKATWVVPDVYNVSLIEIIIRTIIFIWTILAEIMADIMYKPPKDLFGNIPYHPLKIRPNDKIIDSLGTIRINQ
ncbi:uncharacterized protein LOC112684277 [Sipha flava]|uniref:Uncharacterized protein LOC112684277 n=1 Tax=Sipha flava TaxID=143950 RepID=A0A8B8FKP8_9HEMI|nr:uncharacterized protein LOC112684277 [Sipha flava]